MESCKVIKSLFLTLLKTNIAKMSSRLAQQVQTEFITQEFAVDVNRRTLSFSKQLLVPFPVQEMNIRLFHFEALLQTPGYFWSTSLALSSNLEGSSKLIALTTGMKNDVQLIPAVPAPAAPAVGVICEPPSINFQNCKKIFLDSNALTVNGNYTFTVNRASDSIATNLLTLACIVLIQIEFIQYHPIPFYQKLEQYPTREDLEKLDRRQQTAAAILGTGITDELHPEPALRDLTHLAKSTSSSRSQKRVKRLK